MKVEITCSICKKRIITDSNSYSAKNNCCLEHVPYMKQRNDLAETMRCLE